MIEGKRKVVRLVSSVTHLIQRKWQVRYLIMMYCSIKLAVMLQQLFELIRGNNSLILGIICILLYVLCKINTV